MNEGLAPAGSVPDTAKLQQLRAAVAEFGPGELLWASGYLAGLAASAPATREASVPSEAVAQIWVGSQTGNGLKVAEALVADAAGRGVHVELKSLSDIRPRDIGRRKRVLLVLSTHGDGDPPDDAEEFMEFLLGERAPKLDKLEYAVLALGDSSYPHYCKTGRDVDERLAALGAVRLRERVECDLDYHEAASAWSRDLLSQFENEQPAGGQSHSRVIPFPGVSATAASDAWTRDKPFWAELLANQRITGRHSPRDVRHLELSLEDSGIAFEPGDSLGIWPRNAARLVDTLIERLGLDPEQPVRPVSGGTDRSLREELIRGRELTRLAPAVVAGWGEHADSSELRQICGDEDRAALGQFMRSRQFIDLVEEYPAAVDADALLQLLRPLTPRLYSVASSPLFAPDEVHLTVAPINDGEDARQGVASSYLLGLDLDGDAPLPVYLEKNDRFRLPEDGAADVIMIGPGTGVAPFRAFVQHRSELGNSGRNWLFFGARHFHSEFLYQLEWQEHLRRGRLERLDLAFSRDQVHKVYVQQRMLEAAAQLYAWLEEGAYLYVCGDAERMAPDVNEALLQIVRGQAGCSRERAQEYLKDLKRQGRYLRDVY